MFHFSKNVYKRVQDEGMSQLYMNDEEFHTNIRMISALSFIPIADTIQAFDALSNQVGDQDQVILDYSESKYIGLDKNYNIFQMTLFNHSMIFFNLID